MSYTCNKCFKEARFASVVDKEIICDKCFDYSSGVGECIGCKKDVINGFIDNNFLICCECDEKRTKWASGFVGGVATHFQGV